MSFSPSGLVNDGLETGGDAIDAVADWIGW
jgi:hypothetical protein